MTDKEYIKTISQRSTNYLLDTLYDYGYDSYYRDLYYPTMSELKKRAMWHKVADGDLPTDSKEIRWIDNTNNYYNGFYDNNNQQFHADVRCYFNKDEIIAWTELPTYDVTNLEKQQSPKLDKANLRQLKMSCLAKGNCNRCISDGDCKYQ